MKKISSIRVIRVRQSYLGLVFALSALPCAAAPINKAATGTNLNDGPSWVDGTVPGPTDIATWDSSSLCTGLTSGYLPLGGISVGSASSDIDISGYFWLEFEGGGGIDMSASTKNLNLNNTYYVAFQNNSTWTVNEGKTLTVGATPGSVGLYPYYGSSVLTVDGAGNTVLNAWCRALGYTLTKTGTGTLTTGSQLRIAGGKVNVQGGLLSVQASQLMDGGYSTSGVITVSGGGVLELQNWGYGTDQNLGGLWYGISAIVIDGGTIRMNNTATTGDGRNFTIGSGGATLEAKGGNNLWLHNGAAPDNSANGALTLSGSGNGQIDKILPGTATTATLTKSGTGTWTLGGANTYSGDTTVNEGVLAVTGNSIPDTGKLVITSGKVSPTGTEVVGTLFFGLDQKASGTWGATDSGAEHIDDVHFAGTGMVSVTTGPGISYAAWIETEFPGETDPAIIGPDADPDHDGIPNLVEYALKDRKANTSDGPAGTFTGGLLSFTKRPGTTGITYAIQESDDLGVSDLWTSATPTTDTSAEITLQLLPADRAKRFARLNVTQP